MLENLNIRHQKKSKKLNFIRKNFKINVKAAANMPASMFHFPFETILLLKFYFTTDGVRGFKCKIVDRSVRN
jgi:hypothetical protein